MNWQERNILLIHADKHSYSTSFVSFVNKIHLRFLYKHPHFHACMDWRQYTLQDNTPHKNGPTQYGKSVVRNYGEHVKTMKEIKPGCPTGCADEDSCIKKC